MNRIIALLCISVLLFACTKGDGKSGDNDLKNRTVLVYMIADNNLYSNALQNMKEMESVWNDGYDGTLLVYLNPTGDKNSSKLYRITKSSQNVIESTVVKEYGIKQNACDPEVLKQVISDAHAIAPAVSYGLVLWSHGTGWIPKGTPPMKSSKSFGDNDTYRDQMNIDDLSAALPKGLVYDFIAFDACYMASVEVAYQLRNNTKYVIASPTETFARGFIYNEIVSDMMSPVAGVVNIASKIVNFYMLRSGYEQSSTMSVIDCAKLPTVASALKDIIVEDNGRTMVLGTGIQRFDVNSFINQNLFYDLGDFVNKTWPESPGLAKFNQALKSAIPYAGNTPWLFSNVQVKTNSGLTAYVPRRSQPATVAFFNLRMDWSQDSGMSLIQF